MSAYKAIVAKIDKVVEIKGADRIHTAFVLGEQVVVSKDWSVDKVGLFFMADTQLSSNFIKHNNLSRDTTNNIDTTKKGFFEANRRVRCQPFLKVRSEGFFCELSSLSFCGNDYKKLKVGDQFDELGGEHICKKYLNEKTLRKLSNVQKKKTKVQEAPMFHKHVDTQQFKYYVDKIQEGDLLSFHAKVHGTSARYSYSKVVRKPSTIWEKFKNTIGVYKDTSWEYLTGTRNVVLYEDQYDKEGFHGSEQFRFDALATLKPYLTKGMTVYGELAGFANDKPIMSIHSTKGLKNKAFKKKYGESMTYKYGCVEGTCRFHVYRITFTTEDGIEIDFTNDQVLDWCDKHNILAPLEVSPSFIYKGDKEQLVSLVESLTEREDVLTEDYIDPSHVSEGIIIRIDNGKSTPTFYKSKSYSFKVMEGIMKESGEVDLEEIS
jgi:hypothetical protein